MNMFTINGLVTKVFTQPEKVDEATGEVGETKFKVQLLGEMPTQSGEVRDELVTLTCEDRRVHEGLKGKNITVAIGVFCPAKGQAIHYIPKSSKPTVVQDRSS